MEIEFLNKCTLKDNIFNIIELYKLSFDRNLDEKFFEWRYIDNPINELLFVVCKENDKIIASYSASPCLMFKENKIYRTALSLNTMTHPDYQRKGLFVMLAKKLYEYMKEQNYTMIWGFPNNISNRTFNDKLGWSTIYEVPTMTLNTYKVNSLECVSLVEDSNFCLDYSILEKNSIKKFYIKKDTKYLKWRYANNPNNNYITLVIEKDNKVLAYIVVKTYNNLINIIDINYINFEDAQIMINYTINYAKKINKDKVTIWVPFNTELHSYLEKIGFLNDYPIRYLGGKVLNSFQYQNDFLDYRNWFIHEGDNNEY